MRVRVEVTGDGGWGRPGESEGVGQLEAARAPGGGQAPVAEQQGLSGGETLVAFPARPEPAVGFSKLGTSLSPGLLSQALANPASSLGVRAAPVIISVCLVPSEEQALIC